MQLRGLTSLPGYVAKVRLHPNRPFLAALARTAWADHLAVWLIEDNGRLTELVRFEASAPDQDEAAPAWLHRPAWKRPGRMTDLAFHPRQGWLAVVKQGEPARLFQLLQGTPLKRLGTAPADNAIAFSDCGRWAIYATRFPEPWETHATRPFGEARDDERNPRLCDLETDTTTTPPWETDTAYAFHPSGRVVAGGWNDQGGGMIRFLELPNNPDRRIQEFDVAWVNGLAYSPDGTTLAVLEGTENIPHFGLGVYDFDLEPYPSVRLRFAKEWLGSLLPGDQDCYVPWPERVVFNAEGSRLLYPGPCGELIEVEVRSGAEQRRWPAHEKTVTSLDADFRRGLIVSGGRDGRVLLWGAAWSA